MNAKASNVTELRSETAPMLVELPGKLLASALVFAGKKDVRFYLNGVQVEGAGHELRILSTDGNVAAMHRVILSDPVAPFSVHIPRAILENVRTLHRLECVTLERCEGTAWRLVAGGITTEFRADDIRFPDMRQLVPAKLSGELAQFDPDLIARFKKAAKYRHPKIGPNPHLYYNGTGVAVVVHQSDPDFFGLVMPYRPFAPDEFPGMEWVTKPIV